MNRPTDPIEQVNYIKEMCNRLNRAIAKKSEYKGEPCLEYQVGFMQSAIQHFAMANNQVVNIIEMYIKELEA